MIATRNIIFSTTIMDIFSRSSVFDIITVAGTYKDNNVDKNDASGTSGLIDNMYNTADGEEKLEACSCKFGGNRVTQNDQPIIQKKVISSAIHQ